MTIQNCQRLQFQLLIKAGRLEYYISSELTISHDVQLVFARTQVRVAKILKVSVIA